MYVTCVKHSFKKHIHTFTSLHIRGVLIRVAYIVRTCFASGCRHTNLGWIFPWKSSAHAIIHQANAYKSNAFRTRCKTYNMLLGCSFLVPTDGRSARAAGRPHCTQSSDTSVYPIISSSSLPSLSNSAFLYHFLCCVRFIFVVCCCSLILVHTSSATSCFASSCLALCLRPNGWCAPLRGSRLFVNQMDHPGEAAAMQNDGVGGGIKFDTRANLLRNTFPFVENSLSVCLSACLAICPPWFLDGQRVHSTALYHSLLRVVLPATRLCKHYLFIHRDICRDVCSLMITGCTINCAHTQSTMIVKDIILLLLLVLFL